MLASSLSVCATQRRPQLSHLRIEISSCLTWEAVLFTDSTDLIETFKVLSNPARLQIMQWLRDPEVNFAQYDAIVDRRTVGVCVTHIQAKAQLAQSTVSSYMTALERAGLVVSTRVGKWTHYRRNAQRLTELATVITGTL